MTRLEFIDAKSSKFWEVSVQGSTTVTTYGRIGTDGQTRTKDFASAEKATADAIKKTAEKVKKGYVEVSATEDSDRASANTPKPAMLEDSSSGDPSELTVARDSSTGDYREVKLSAAWKKKVRARRDRPSASFPFVPPINGAAFHDIYANATSRRLDRIEAGIVDSPLSAEVAALLLEDPATLEATEAHLVAASLRWHILGRSTMWQVEEEIAVATADYWVTEAGLAFAIEAAERAHWWQLPDYWREPVPGAFATRTTPRSMGKKSTFLAIRLRHHLAVANDADYQLARAAAERVREMAPEAAMRISVMFPNEREWFDELVAGPTKNLMPLMLAVSSGTELKTLLDEQRAIPPDVGDQFMTGALYSVLDAVGESLAPFLGSWIGQGQKAPTTKALIQALKLIGTDDAMLALADNASNKYVMPVLTKMAAAQPGQALRVLPQRLNVKAVAQLAADVVAKHPDLAGDAGIAAEEAAGDAATPDHVHRLLASPPWENRTSPKARTTLQLDPICPPATVDVPLIEALPVPAGLDLRARAQELKTPPDAPKGRYPQPRWGLDFFKSAPTNMIEDVLTDWVNHFPRLYNPVNSSRIFVSRLGIRAVPFMRCLLDTAITFEALAPFDAAEVAPWFARMYATTRSAQTGLWLIEHRRNAAYGLIPDLLGDHKDEHERAAVALRLIAEHDADVIRGAADDYGVKVRTAIDAFLADDRLDRLPKRMPEIPIFVSLGSMTLPTLRDGSGTLSTDAAENLVLMFALSENAEPYAGLAQVLPTLNVESTAEFAWQLFERWEGANYPSKQSWILNALGIVGTDETVRRITPFIRAWPGQSGHARATKGLDVLTAIGSDLALMQLYRISQKIKYRGLRGEAADRIQDLAAWRGLSQEQLGDRLVPDCDLNPKTGSMKLDYGPRSFTVEFDESLKPVVRDDSGKLRKTLPKPGKNDDNRVAAASYKQFSALKKDVRSVASDQLDRLETAMVTQRRWPAVDFRAYFVDHPLVIHLARRLVWGVFEDGALMTTFRIAEDGSFADSGDNAVALDDDAIVGLPHPIEFGKGVLTPWSEVLSDYEILQPFSQIGREVFTLTDRESSSTELTRFSSDTKHPFGTFLSLEKHGWGRDGEEFAGISPGLSYYLPEGGRLALPLEEGLFLGDVSSSPDQKLTTIRLSGPKDVSQTLGDIDDLLMSEILRTLTTTFM